MKKLLTVIVASAISISVFSQTTQAKKPVICADINLLLSELANSEYKEKAIWLGTDEHKHKFVLFMNQTTGSWTIIEMNDRIACILGTGDTSEFNKNQVK